MVRRVIGLTGLPRAGKGTVRKILNRIIHPERICEVSSGSIIQRVLEEKGLQNSRDREAKQAIFLELKELEGENWVLKRIIAALEESNRAYGIVDALCTPQDISWLLGLRESVLIYAYAPFELRLARARLAALRGEDDSKPDEAEITPEEFAKREQHETAKHIPGFRKIPVVRVVTHDSTIEHLGRQVIAVAFAEKILSRQEELFHVSRGLNRFYEEFRSKNNI